MIKTPWVNQKTIDFTKVAKELEQSFALNQMTNYGPVVKRLEDYFAKEMNVNQDRAVIVVCNAAIGLHMLVSGINMFYDRNLRYATQSFTFPCAVQGPLQNAQIVDFDEDLNLDLSQVDEDVEGIIVTNLFGNVCDLDKYLNCGKIVLLDNATVPFSDFKGVNVNNFGTATIISLHHTKIFSHSEGGLIIVDKKYENCVRRCINFGFEVVDGRVLYSKYGSNGKMNEVTAAVILTYLKDNKERILDHQIKMYDSFKDKIKDLEGVRLFPNYSSSTPVVSCFALLFDREIGNDIIYQFELNNITTRKYYTPLDDAPISNRTFKHILCLPCNLQVLDNTLDAYVRIISKLL